jgi:hypothetical protein
MNYFCKCQTLYLISPPGQEKSFITLVYILKLMQNKLGHYYLLNFLSSYSKNLNPGHLSDAHLKVGFQNINQTGKEQTF